MLPPTLCRLGPALAHLLHRLLLSEPACPLLRPRRFRVSGSPSGRWTMLLWTSKCPASPCSCCRCSFPTLFPCCVTRLSPAVKRRRESEVVPLESVSPPATAPLSMSKGGDCARASRAQSSSQGPVEHPREESAPEAPLAQEVPVSSSGAEVQEAQEPPAS